MPRLICRIINPPKAAKPHRQKNCMQRCLPRCIHEGREGEALLLAEDEVGQIHEGENVHAHFAQSFHARRIGQPRQTQQL